MWQDYREKQVRKYKCAYMQELYDCHPDFRYTNPTMLPAVRLDAPATILYGQCIYLIGPTNGLIKIGYSKQLNQRRYEIAKEVGVPEVQVIATMPGDKRGEAKLHRRFDNLRVWKEWFQDQPEIREAFC